MCEDMGGRGEAETESPELIHTAKHHKSKILVRLGMNWNLQVCFLQADGHHPVPQTNRKKNRLDGLHLEGRGSQKTIEMREVYEWTPRPRGLPHHKETAVKARRRQKSQFDRFLGNEGPSNLPHSNPLGGHGSVRRQEDGFPRQWRNTGKGNKVPPPENFHTQGSVPLSLQAC